MAGAFALLPSCNFGPDRELVALDNLQIDLDHQDLLAKVIETIIPSTEAEPGAEALNLYRFVLVMVDVAASMGAALIAAECCNHSRRQRHSKFAPFSCCRCEMSLETERPRISAQEFQGAQSG